MTALAPLPQDALERERYYEPRGAALELMTCRAKEILIEGPAGTGKSRAVLEKINLCCLRYPRIRCLVVRKTRASCTDSILVTWEEKVIPEGDPITAGASRKMRSHYDYANGSQVVVGGIDKPSKIMSSEYDLICAFEATELTQDDWEMLSTRRRNAVLPYQQQIADCNPAGPSHWLNQRANKGLMKRLLSRHEHNPVYHDGDEWTQFGLDYLATLDGLSGARKDRLRWGKWVAAEGAVYADWDPAIHIIDTLAPAPQWYFTSVDWGYTNPGVFLTWGVDGDRRMTCVHQVYHTHRERDYWEEHARQIRLRFNPHRGFVADPSDAEMIGWFRRKGYRMIEAKNEIFAGLRCVQARLIPAGDGKPRLYFLRNNLVDRDLELVNASEPFCAEQEFESYLYPDPTEHEDKNAKEEPIDHYNHGMDAMRYAAMHLDFATGSPLARAPMNMQQKERDRRAHPR